MRVTRAWRATCALVAAVGIGLGMLEWGPLVTLSCLLAVTVVSASVVVGVRSFRLTDTAEPDVWWGRGVLGTAALSAACLVACCAFVRLSPSLALLLVTVAACTSPLCRAALRRLRRRGDGGAPTGPARTARTTVVTAPRVAEASHAEARPTPADLDDADLCRLWRRSFWELMNETSPARYLEVVLWRQACLDEMERRDAAALRAWLESGARASGGPEKFLRPPSTGHGDAA